jgi:NADH pyrophosphatase NudC (nudix superfamily)
MAQQFHFLAMLDKGWPFAASVMAGVFAFGSLNSDMTSIKEQQHTMWLDHDRVTTLIEGQKELKEGQSHIQEQLDRIEKQRSK